MGGSRTRRSALLYLVMQAAAVAVALWLAKQYQVARLSATAIALVPTLPAAWLAWRAYREDRREAALDLQPRAEALAAAVLAAETRQRAQLIGEGGHRIDVHFRYRPEPANNAAGAADEGRLSEVVDYYRRLRPARLVITGDPGAGKTLLAVELLLGLLTDPHRAPTAPVPVRASLAGWDTVQPLEDWLTEQIHSQLGDTGLTPQDARQLLKGYRVLPVLDGLDEMDADSLPLGARRAPRALARLNDYQDAHGGAPVILTCRTTQYAELAAADLRMRESARIEIVPVSAGQATAYVNARSTSPGRWRPVTDALTADPDGTLARALNTPWRLNLATTVYEERDRGTLAYARDPAELLALATPESVRDHLLTAYVPVATRQHRTGPGRYEAADVHRWLARLAVHLAATPGPPAPTGTPGTPGATGTPGTPGAAGSGAGTDLVLHQLWPLAGRRRVRAADVLLTTVLACVFAAALLSQVPIGFTRQQILGASGFVLFAVSSIIPTGQAVVPPPTALQLQRLKHPEFRRKMTGQVLKWVWYGVASGVASGLVSAFMIRSWAVLDFSLVFGVVFGLAGGLAVGLVVELTGSPPVTGGGQVTAVPVDPRMLIRNDLWVGSVLALAFGLAGGLAVGLAGESVLLGFTAGLAVGLGLGLYGMFDQSGGAAARRYMVFLVCTRDLPWRLGAFLHWAYGAGLLRVSGTAYQFRHRELQDWLAAHPVPGAP
ncbi:NACHT domain-containing protein [Streptomyces sp. B1866]|uniref:NACHT domain-containing protein n=1 Tax=Streptomyces sp. B1866 TaxID=3075431 RepID=UPI00289120F1|nr:NACHT domain-containing protein [Streptomyces sp. B1866]MDT3399298.1 NACHT domain-containing protein [Streptomyces sp. B1866]